MSARRVIVVDCETSSLAPDDRLGGLIGAAPLGEHYGVVTEVAWHDLGSDERGVFVPRHDVRLVRAHGAIKALTISGYLERLAEAEQDDGTEVRALHERLTGRAMAGSNPSFDARFLRQLFRAHGTAPGCPGANPEPWHHRLCDLAGYAAGRLGLAPGDLPGLARVCELLEVEPPDHTAAGDVRATVECLRRLEECTPGDVAGADQ